MSNDFGKEALELCSDLFDAADSKLSADVAMALLSKVRDMIDQHHEAMRPLLRRIANLERYNAGLAQESCERRQRIEELESRISEPEMRTFSVSIPASAIGETGNWNDIARALCDPETVCVIEELEKRISE